MIRLLKVREEQWASKVPFRISGHTWEAFDLVVCELHEGGMVGRGEAAGVFYRHETAASMRAQIEEATAGIQAGADREQLLSLLPPGGARNALDCALWDLDCKRFRRNAWDLAGVRPDPVTTVFTIGLEDTPAAMAAKAAAAADRPLLKIKLNADRPVERIEAIRRARPDARLVADCNGGWTFEQLAEWAPRLRDLGLELLEQPLARGHDAMLSDYEAPLPLFADESCLHVGEVRLAVGRYAGIVMKLDKTGGLTGALALAQAARSSGLRLMVGCMVATSLSMAPAHVLAQLCEFVDIDGPLLLKEDRVRPLCYEGAKVTVPEDVLWGVPK